MNIAIAISFKDEPIATLWARWLVAVGVAPKTRFILTVCGKTSKGTADTVKAELEKAGKVEFSVCTDGDKIAYPGAANKMFIHAARRAAQHGPFLWMEADMYPMMPGWHEALIKEYNECGKPFLGPILHVFDTPHLNGTAVYPKDWEQITNITQCPNHWPWDTFARTTVTEKGLAYESQILHHSYGNKSFPKDWGGVPDHIQVFHPCKDGTLVKELNDRLKLLDNTAIDLHTMYVMFEGNGPGLYRVPNLRKVNMPGATWHIAQLDHIQDQILAFRSGNIHVISKEEYQTLFKQSQPT